MNAFERFVSDSPVAEMFGAQATLAAMLDFEAALARAQASCGLIPAEAAMVIASSCKLEGFDVESILLRSGEAGSLAIPLVQALTAKVHAVSPAAARHVHWGSTSQDVIDTALVLQTRKALRLIDDELAGLIAALLRIAEAHADTPVLARTMMQAAQVTSLGWKAIGWVSPLIRVREHLRGQARQGLALQLGGAIGTLAAYGPAAQPLARALAESLSLHWCGSNWHTQRDAWMRLASEVAVLTGSLGKLATDLALMAQTEVGELAEPSAPGRGTSTALPHKRNPVAAMVALAAARRAPGRMANLFAAMTAEHERGLGNWQAELAEWPGLFISAEAAVRNLRLAFEGLEVHEGRMRANIGALQGLIFAEELVHCLARELGRPEARAWVDRLCAEALDGRGSLPERLAEAAQHQPEVVGPALLEQAMAVFSVERAVEPARDRVREALPGLRERHAALMVGVGDTRRA